jgi:transmembrane sensor
MKKSLSKELLFEFFDGRTTSLQRKLIEDWLAEPENEDLYYQYLDEWESAHPQFAPNVKVALSSYVSLLNNKTNNTSHAGKMKVESGFGGAKRKWVWTAFAASLLLIFIFVFRTDIIYKSLKSNNGEVASFKLQDGTEVILNANSVLRVPRLGFGNQTRKVLLEGEGEFKVVHTEEDSRFIVQMKNDYSIEVLGTEFVAFSRERGTKVFLVSGKVKLSLPEGKQLYLKPGSLFASNSKGGGAITKPQAPEQFTAWKKEMFYFDNTSLSEVAEQIHERFNVKVRIPDPVLAQHKIGGVYTARQADDLLEILSELLQLEVIKHNEFIELRKSVNVPDNE